MYIVLMDWEFVRCLSGIKLGNRIIPEIPCCFLHSILIMKKSSYKAGYSFETYRKVLWSSTLVVAINFSPLVIHAGPLLLLLLLSLKKYQLLQQWFVLVFGYGARIKFTTKKNDQSEKCMVSAWRGRTFMVMRMNHYSVQHMEGKNFMVIRMNHY